MSGIAIYDSSMIRYEYENGLARQRILAETSPDIDLVMGALQAGCTWDPEIFSEEDKMQIFVFTGGCGIVRSGNRIFSIDEQSVFIPDFDREEVQICAGEEELRFIHIVGPMIDVDRRQMKHCHYILPRFVRFSESIRYTERFTQESGAKVWQHSVIAGRHLGRYTMGWVIGEGPDFVGQHVHPSLEQWYFMLDGADFIYHAGDKAIPVKEGDVSFTPHGTYHGSECTEDGFINYLWFELNRAWEML